MTRPTLALSAALALLVVLLQAVEPARAQQSPAPAPAPERGGAATALAAARSWGYQLLNLDVKALAASPYDVLVIDYSRDGSEAEALTAADLAALRQKPDGGRRIVLSYLSIGEAESYRYYWNKSWSDLWFIPNFWSKPAWRARLNGDWGGNYAVRYWDPAWQRIILGDGAPGQSTGYLDRIVRAGFDGVWLDKVDSSLEDVAARNPNARADMVAFVGRIAERARAVRPEFLIVPQNGEELLSDDWFRRIIDGFGKESLLYGEDGPGKPNPPSLVEKRLGHLQKLTADGKPVLAVEYLDDRATADAAVQRLASLGLVPLVATRQLDIAPGQVRADAQDAGRRGLGLASGAKSASRMSPALWLGIMVVGAVLLAIVLRRR